MHRTIWNPLDEGVVGYWGASTSSLDWCESNYAWTFYIAELVNTLSSFSFVAIGAFGIFRCRQQKLPLRYALTNLGTVGVGLGSVLFHATLLYSSQMADELPMIIGSTLLTFMIFDISPLGAPHRYGLSLFLVAFDAAFIWSYLYYPNPVFHQVCFAGMMCATVFRTVRLLTTHLIDTPEAQAKNTQARRLLGWGTVSVLFAFFIWNCDNLLCEPSVALKEKLGAPLQFGLEGHAWWHLFIGYGFLLIGSAMSSATLSIRDAPENYELRFELGFLPWAARTDKGWAALASHEPSKGRKVD